MFDIGFFELLVIGVVGLLVIGPERLPETVRSAALWWGRLKRAIQSTRSEIEQQIGADDIRRQLHNEEVMQRLQATQEEVKRAVSENVEEINQALDVGEDVTKPLNELKETLESMPSSSDKANAEKTSPSTDSTAPPSVTENSSADTAATTTEKNSSQS